MGGASVRGFEGERDIAREIGWRVNLESAERLGGTPRDEAFNEQLPLLVWLLTENHSQ
jgi:hypothetical protein